MEISEGGRSNKLRKIRWQMVILVILLSLVYLQFAKPIQKQTTTVSPSPTPAVLGISIGTKTSNCMVNGPLPDRECSPGAIFAEAAKEQVCVPGYSQKVRDVPVSEKNDVYDEYNIYSHKTGEYEIDHIISLELGGSNDIANLYPEAAEPVPGFHQKDALENLLHKKVCDGEIGLHEAQVMISTDWVSAYKKYLGDN